MAQPALRDEPDLVSPGWVERPDGPVLTTTKTKRSHVVDLDPESFTVLVEYAATAATAADGFVFSDDDGIIAWTPNRVTKAFLPHPHAAGLRSFRLHGLRHLMAAEMLDAGVPIVTVSRRLDHGRVSTTLNKYAHAFPDGDARAYATLHAIITRQLTESSVTACDGTRRDANGPPLGSPTRMRGAGVRSSRP